MRKIIDFFVTAAYLVKWLLVGEHDRYTKK